MMLTVSVTSRIAEVKESGEEEMINWGGRGEGRKKKRPAVTSYHPSETRTVNCPES